jgi:hypothetical protein
LSACLRRKRRRSEQARRAIPGQIRPLLALPRNLSVRRAAPTSFSPKPEEVGRAAPGASSNRELQTPNAVGCQRCELLPVARERAHALGDEPSPSKPRPSGLRPKRCAFLRRPARDQFAGVMILVSTGTSLAVKPT